MLRKLAYCTRFALAPSTWRKRAFLAPWGWRLALAAAGQSQVRRHQSPGPLPRQWGNPASAAPARRAPASPRNSCSSFLLCGATAQQRSAVSPKRKPLPHRLVASGCPHKVVVHEALPVPLQVQSEVLRSDSTRRFLLGFSHRFLLGFCFRVRLSRRSPELGA